MLQYYITPAPCIFLIRESPSVQRLILLVLPLFPCRAMPCLLCPKCSTCSPGAHANAFSCSPSPSIQSAINPAGQPASQPVQLQTQ